MLVFGAVFNRDLGHLDADTCAQLARGIPAIPGVLSAHTADGAAVVHLADHRPLPNDAELPLMSDDLVIAGVVRIDARDALCRKLGLADTGVLPSDVRLVALAYARWGAQLAEHLLGDFALAIWDKPTRRLVLLRDPHGNRQLFWATVGQHVVVSSAIGVVRGVPGISAELHEPSIVSLLRDGWIEDAERTSLAAIRRVPGGHTLTFERNQAPRLHRHWEYPVPAPIRYRDDRDYVAHFNEVLDSTLRDRLRGDSAAVFLSGGMDSTTLAASARRVAPAASLHGLTIIYPTLAPSDDDALGALAARQLGLTHEYVDFESSIALEHLDDPDALPPQPFDENDLGCWRATAGAAARRAPVALFGEDGDSLLQSPTLLNQLRTQPLAEVVGSWASYWWTTGRRPWMGLDWRRRLARLWRRREGRHTPWLRADAVRRVGIQRRARATHPLRPLTTHSLSSPQWDSLYTTLAPTTTRASVLFTLPLVDPRLLGFVFALPPVPWCQDKRLFRAAMRGVLPPAIVDRPKTALSGYVEGRVAQWRASGGAEIDISSRVAPWVDVAAVRAIYRTGAPYDVIEAWRVVQLDRWLAREDSARAHRVI